jgi:hypothetical protein
MNKSGLMERKYTFWTRIKLGSPSGKHLLYNNVLNRFFLYFFGDFLDYLELFEPQIIYFYTDHIFHQRKEISLLRWHVRYVRRISINGQTFASKGYFLFDPVDTAHFVLIAKNKQGEVIREHAYKTRPDRIVFRPKILPARPGYIFSKKVSLKVPRKSLQSSLTIMPPKVHLSLIRACEPMKVQLRDNAKPISLSTLQLSMEKSKQTWDTLIQSK